MQTVQSVCSQVSGWAQTTFSVPTPKAVFRALALVASVFAAYYNPVRGVALLLTSLVIIEAVSKISTCLGRVKKVEIDVEQQKNFSRRIEAIAHQLQASAISTSPLFGVIPQDAPSCSIYTDESGDRKYIFHVHYNYKEKLSRGNETIYIDRYFKRPKWVIMIYNQNNQHVSSFGAGFTQKLPVRLTDKWLKVFERLAQGEVVNVEEGLQASLTPFS